MCNRFRHLVCVILTLGIASSHGSAGVVGVGDVVMDGNMLVSATTTDGYTVTTKTLRTGTTTAPGGEGAQYPPEWADDFDFSNAASNVYPLTTVDFGGELWFNANGDAPDFFVFEAAGSRNVTDFRALFPDGTVGQPLVVQNAQWLDTGVVGAFDQKIAGIAFSITDLKDADGNNLPDSTELKGIVIGQSNTGVDPVVIAAVVGEIFVAHAPIPADGGLITETWANLSWKPGSDAVSHNIYIGDNFDDVNDATVDSPVFRGNQLNETYFIGFTGYPYPEGLLPGMSYYWRIDEVNDASAASPWKGEVWSFLVPPRTAYNPAPADGAEFVDLSANLSWTAGNGAKIHTVFLGDNYDDVNAATVGTQLGVTTYNPGTLEREKVYYWRVDESDGIEAFKGAVWAFTTPGAVGNSQPANGAVDVPMTATLSWTAADNAASHELYFGTDADAVKNATTTSPEYVGPRALGAERYDPGGLGWDSSYAWRVDEVYPTGTVKGLVWTFTTADFIVVDDFEAYNDIDPPDPNSNTIYSNWIDGYGIPTNGALTSEELPPYAEQTIVHGGGQSMKYQYDTNFLISESTLTLIYPKDWTEQGVTELILWFRGSSTNAAERMFVALNGNAVVYHDDPAASQIAGWKEWVVDLQKFADQGVNLTNVSTITIGFGTKNIPAAGGAGEVYFDDIRLYR